MNRPSSTYRPTASSDTHSAVIVCFASSGKEKDLETGLSYFGARYSTSFRDVSWQRPQASLGALLLKRYYDADLTTGWLSVDPMADKYPGMSPYHYCHWNPIGLVDLDGNEDDNYYICGGQIYKEKTDDKTNSYYYLDEGEYVLLGTYEKVTNKNNEDLVKVGNDATGMSPTNLFTWSEINSGNLYYEEDAFALFLCATYLFKKNHKVDVQVNQFMSIDKGHSISKEGRCASIDIAYINTSGKPNARTYQNTISKSLNQDFFDILKAYGLGSVGSYSNIPVDGNKPFDTSKGAGKPFLKGTTAVIPHHHHFHLEGFSKKRIYELS